MTGIRFMIKEDGEVARQGLPNGGVIEIAYPKFPFREFPEQFILDHYNRLKKENPNATILVVVENIIQETYVPLQKLNEGDIGILLGRLDEKVKKGI